MMSRDLYARAEAEERVRIRNLWMLLFEDPKSLDDNQITQLLEAEEELRSITYRVWSGSPHTFEMVRRYRAKKQELSKLSTEKLVAMRQVISRRIQATLASTPEKDLSNSFFEDPPNDSEENILDELLKERNIDWRSQKNS